MQTPFSLFLALRYLQPKRSFVSVITVISIVGVMLGIATLILVISVMTGFDHELRRKVLGFEAHVMVNDPGGVLREWQPLLKEIRGVPNVVAAAPFVQGPVIIEFKNQRLAPKIRGIDPAMEEKVIPEIRSKFIKEGKFDLTGDTTVIGIDLARMLGVHVGDKITVYSPGNLGEVLATIKKAEKDPKVLESLKSLVLPSDLTVTGIFESGRFVYDSEILLVPLHIGQELYAMEDAVHGISVRTADPNRAGEVRNAILGTAPEGLSASTWEDLNRNFFDAVAMERNVMFFLLLFIVVVAAFGIMNTLITVTVQKTREIGILKAIGARTGQIVWVFLGQGMVVGVFGNVAGLALGMTLLTFRNEFKDWLGRTLGIQVFPADVYQFSKIPAEVVWFPDVFIICASAFVICSIAAWIPAYVAARMDPVKALRQE